MISKESKTIGRKIVIADFRKLNPSIFLPYHNLDKKTITNESVLCSADGKIFINKKSEFAEYLAETFELLIQETRETLKEFESQMKDRFPEIRSFEDWAKMTENEENRNMAFAMLMVPVELKRRGIEEKYYK